MEDREPKITRRSFLIGLGAGALAGESAKVAAVSYGIAKAGELAKRTIENLKGITESDEVELSSIPKDLIDSAVSLKLNFRPEDPEAFGSGVLIDKDTKNNIVYGITAKHVLRVEDRVPGTITLSQPHLTKGTELQAEGEQIATAVSKDIDLGVFAMKVSDASGIKTLGGDNILKDWGPFYQNPVVTVGNAPEKSYFSLGFPYNGDDLYVIAKEVSFPRMQITQEIGTYEANPNKRVPRGFSGAGLVDKNGKLVGVQHAINKLRIPPFDEWISFTPINQEYSFLVKEALDELRSLVKQK